MVYQRFSILGMFYDNIATRTKKKKKTAYQFQCGLRLAHVQHKFKLLLKREKILPSRIRVLNLPGTSHQVALQEPYLLLEPLYPPTSLENSTIQILELPLRLEKGIRPQRNLPHQMQLHDVEVVRELLLKHRILGRRRKRAGGPERHALLEREVFLEVQRRHLSEARNERLPGASTRQAEIGNTPRKIRRAAAKIRTLALVVAYILEPGEGLGNGRQVGIEARAGDLGEDGLGNQGRGRLRRSGGGGGGAEPAGPGTVGGVDAGLADVGIVQDGGEGVVGSGTEIGGGSGWGRQGRGAADGGGRGRRPAGIHGWRSGIRIGEEA